MAGSAASAPLVDLSQRVSALEIQQRALTGQVEQLQFQLRQLESAMQKLRGDAEFRLDALEGKGTATPAQPFAEAPVAARPAPESAPVAANPVADMDSAEAAYLAGYRQYQRGEYGAAVKALSAFAAANPKHPRASNAQFWAGRAMMAQGQNAEAAKAFLAGYQQFPRGERAHNSLLWLGKALTAMNQLKAACQALDQLRTAYPERLTGAVANEAAAARTAAKCGA
jgi:tol-pal system protein YbgF